MWNIGRTSCAALVFGIHARHHRCKEQTTRKTTKIIFARKYNTQARTHRHTQHGTSAAGSVGDDEEEDLRSGALGIRRFRGPCSFFTTTTRIVADGDETSRLPLDLLQNWRKRQAPSASRWARDVTRNESRALINPPAMLPPSGWKICEDVFNTKLFI